MEEQWKAVPGYEGYYEVSNLGRVRSLDRTVSCIRAGKLMTRSFKSRILKPVMCGAYHPHVLLAKDGEHKMVRVDRLHDLVWPGPVIEDTEEWRPVPDFEELYEVAKSGKVRRKARKICRCRNIDGDEVKDSVAYIAKELKPQYYQKMSGTAVYHFHRKHESGYRGQINVYWPIDDLVRLVFPENQENI